MKSIITTILLALCLMPAFAQEEDAAPFYLPGEGVYLVGLPSDLNPVVSEPTMVTQAYQAKFITTGAELAAVRSGQKSYNVTSYFNDDNSVLNLVRFMGIGEASGLIVRNFDGESYELGSLAPEKTWYYCRLLAAYDSWRGHKTFPLCMYDQWDCPVSFDADPMLASDRNDAVTVSFSNAHEGLVVSNVNFPLAVASGSAMDLPLTVRLSFVNEVGNTETYETTVTPSALTKVADHEGFAIYSAVAKVSRQNIVIKTKFEVSVSGFAQKGVDAWIPRAIDTHGLYPSHTVYFDGERTESEASADACINVEGYFNYIGSYGWYDGKYERGEVVGSADLVQVYYDPADADWPGDYFMGEAAFPIESTFGSSDITILEMPEWINSISYDDSQWAEYGAIQITLAADALPSEVNGRNGKVVLITSDHASRYTIYIRQGAAWFDMESGVSPVATISLPKAGGVFDLAGRRISPMQSNGINVKNNKIILNK